MFQFVSVENETVVSYISIDCIAVSLKFASQNTFQNLEFNFWMLMVQLKELDVDHFLLLNKYILPPYLKS